MWVRGRQLIGGEKRRGICRNTDLKKKDMQHVKKKGWALSKINSGERAEQGEMKLAVSLGE